MEEIFSVPQPFVISRFHFSRRTEGFEILLFYNTNCKLVVAALTSKKAYILYLCHKDPPIVAIYILTAPRGAAVFMEIRYFHLSTITYVPNPFISVLHNFALSQQKSEYLRLTLENFLKKALLLV